MQKPNRSRRVHSAASGLKYQSARPQKDTAALLIALILCLLLPPVGVVYAWRARLKSALPRIALTFAGTAAMIFLFSIVLYQPQSIDEILPSPVVPYPFSYEEIAAPAPGSNIQTEEVGAPALESAATLPPDVAPAPDSMDANAGDDSDDWDLWSDPGAAPETDAQPEPTVEPEPSHEPTDDEIIVYAVEQNASRYHAYETCDGQLNARELTLAQAKEEGLTPCKTCKPKQ